MLMSNYTTSAVSVASVATLCSSGTTSYPVVEATITSVHQVTRTSSRKAVTSDLSHRGLRQEICACYLAREIFLGAS